MYLPRQFEQGDAEALRRLMHEHPLACIVRQGPDGLAADHVPLVFDPAAGPHGVLRGHLARANPLWREADGAPVLAVFQGPQAYVSPSWYPGKAEHHKVVPTWNYAVVHAGGTLRARADAAWLHEFVSRLTLRHEAGRATPWAVSDAPADYVAQMLEAIVGIEIEVATLVGKWKLSQNRGLADRDAVAAALESEPGQAAAAARLMRDSAPR
jgi:transcriptional regulator